MCFVFIVCSICMLIIGIPTLFTETDEEGIFLGFLLLIGIIALLDRIEPGQKKREERAEDKTTAVSADEKKADAAAETMNPHEAVSTGTGSGSSLRSSSGSTPGSSLRSSSGSSPRSSYGSRYANSSGSSLGSSSASSLGSSSAGSYGSSYPSSRSTNYYDVYVDLDDPDFDDEDFDEDDLDEDDLFERRSIEHYRDNVMLPAGGLPRDLSPYWEISDPYERAELEELDFYDDYANSGLFGDDD